jgi:uncharacterized small protein (DUF1192 family)
MSDDDDYDQLCSIDEKNRKIESLQAEVDRLKDEIRYRDGMKALENQAQLQATITELRVVLQDFYDYGYDRRKCEAALKSTTEIDDE